MAGGCEGFVDADLDAGEFGCGHADEVEEVEGAVDEGDIEVWTSYMLADLIEIQHRRLGSIDWFNAML